MRLLAALLFTVQLGAQDGVRLEGHVLNDLQKAVRLVRTPEGANQPISLTVMLNWSDPVGFELFREDFETPGSPGYGKSLRPDELKARFGPSQEAYDTVLAWLQQNGFTLTQGSENRLTLTVRGTRAQAEKAFDVKIDDYVMGSRRFHAIATGPAIPGALAPMVRCVTGFSNLGHPRPATSPQAVTQAYNGTLTPAGTLPGAGPGVLPPGLNGAGQTIALVEYDSFNPADVSYWLSQMGLPASLVNQVTIFPVNGATTAPSGCSIFANNCGTGEVLVDIAGALTVAQGANIVVVVAPQGTDEATLVSGAMDYLNQVQGKGGVISVSVGGCEPDYTDAANDGMEALLQTLYVTGQSLFAATGDHGATCDQNHPNSIGYPDNAPHAIAVGGTSIQPLPNGNYGSESWWLNAAGFGISRHFDRPFWQIPFTSASKRSVPDVSGFASPGIPICQNSKCTYQDGQGFVIGGTSLAAPMWAGVWAIASQAQSLAQGTVTGAQGPFGGAIYSLTAALHPASGMTGPGNDFAHLGLGSPNITSVVSLVAGPPTVSGTIPEIGTMAGGTSVTIKGHAFIGVSEVLFGSVPATSFTVDSESQITAISPPSSSGSVNITVETPAGSVTTTNVQFKYQPGIGKISPSSGPLTGFTTVTVTGGGFAAGVNAQNPFFFGGVPATNVQCPTTTQCTMWAPAHAIGTVSVTYTGAVPSNVQFAYTGPAISSVSPNSGGESGGTQVNLVGTGLSQSMVVHFGNSDVSPECPFENGGNQSVTGCTVVSPAGTGSVHITFTVNGTTSPATSADLFTYQPLPFGNMSPASGTYKGGTVVTVTGGNFSTAPEATQFSFSGAPATNVKCGSTKVCTMTTPAIPAPAAIADEGGVVQVTATANRLTGALGPFSYTGTAAPPQQKPIPCKGICH